MSKIKKKLSVGLLIDDIIVNREIYELIEFSLKSHHYQITSLIIQKTPSNKNKPVFYYYEYIKRRGFKKFIENASFTILEKLESLILARIGKHKNYFDKFNLIELNINSIIVHPSLSKSGLIYRYNDDDLKQIENQNLDLLIRCGGGIQRGKILNICRLGIISFHHANNNLNRGGPPGFWEVYNKEAVTGFVIQILKDELDGGDVLFKGNTYTKLFYLYNRAELYSKSNIFMHTTIENLSRKSSNIVLLPKKPYSNLLYSTPSLFIQLHYTLRLIKTICSYLVRYILSIKLRWGVAYKFIENWDDVVIWKSTKIKNPLNVF